jgi:EAL domain-containing protein (putative c-di-GMP-specific phosphodiesterase class I)
MYKLMTGIDKSLLAPDTFLPLIEDHLLAIDIGEWVIDTALSQLEYCHTTSLNIPVSVNIGARQLQQESFIKSLRTLLAAHPTIKWGDLELEILETSAIEDLNKVSQLIRPVRLG